MNPRAKRLMNAGTRWSTAFMLMPQSASISNGGSKFVATPETANDENPINTDDRANGSQLAVGSPIVDMSAAIGKLLSGCTDSSCKAMLRGLLARASSATFASSVC